MKHYYTIRAIDTTGLVYSFTGFSCIRWFARVAATLSMRRHERRYKLSLRIVKRIESTQAG